MKLNQRKISNYLLYVITMLLSNQFYSQVGINTSSPKASLHMEASNPTSPTATDGILIPRTYTLPSSGVAKGQLIFLERPDSTSGFYIWTGQFWDPLLKQNVNRYIDESIYVATGNNTGSTYSDSHTESSLVLTSIAGSDTTGFSVSGNSITIGKSGSYLVNVSSSLKTTTGTNGGKRATFKYTLKKESTGTNNTPQIDILAQAASSIPNEADTATNISFSNIVDLKQGDKIFVTRMKNSEGTNSADVEFLPYGNNTVRLTFLQ